MKQDKPGGMTALFAITLTLLIGRVAVGGPSTVIDDHTITVLATLTVIDQRKRN